MDARVIRDRLAELNPDIVCLTETHHDFLSEWDGYTVCGTDDWGGETQGTRREVLLWSRHPWFDIDVIGSPSLPPGRFARGTTLTPFGEITVVGVVIPYHMSNVRHGTRDKKMWELHRAYLKALPEVTSGLGSNSIVMGDFNQRIPSRWVPQDLRKGLVGAMSGMTIVTEGALEPIGKQAIDHVAVGGDLRALKVRSICNMQGRRQISDHFGVSVQLLPRAKHFLGE